MKRGCFVRYCLAHKLNKKGFYIVYECFIVCCIFKV